MVQWEECVGTEVFLYEDHCALKHLKEHVCLQDVSQVDHGALIQLKEEVCFEVVLWVVKARAGSRGTSVGEKVGTRDRGDSDVIEEYGGKGACSV